MEFLHSFVDFFLHLDHHMDMVIQQYGGWTYLIVFLIIFCETGLVVTPFLPGDSLLFVLGTLAAAGSLDLKATLLLLVAAAILGNMLNYQIGRMLAPRVFRNEKIRFLKKEYLDRTQQFFGRYGASAIIVSRFLPILRTFAPFMAGVGNMNYWRFAFYNFLGGTLWVTTFVLGGYFFGNLPPVRKNFSLAMAIIIILSIIPAVWEFFRHRHAEKSPS